MDLVAYGTGMTDKFQGTGVFNSIKFERDGKDDSGGSSNTASSSDSKTSAKKKDASK